MQSRQNLGNRAREMITWGVGGEGSRIGEKEKMNCSAGEATASSKPKRCSGAGKASSLRSGHWALNPGVACHSVRGFNLGPSLVKASSEEPLC